MGASALTRLCSTRHLVHSLDSRSIGSINQHKELHSEGLQKEAICPGHCSLAPQEMPASAPQLEMLQGVYFFFLDLPQL